MSKPITISKRRLYSYAEQIDNWQRTGRVEYELLQGRIKDFYKDYSLYLQLIQKDIKRIENYFFVKDGDQIKTEGDGKDAKPVFQEGKNEYSFNENWKVLMSQIAGAKFEIKDYAPEPSLSVVE